MVCNQSHINFDWFYIQLNIILNYIEENKFGFIECIYSNQKRHALEIPEDLSKLQPVNSHLKQFDSFLDAVCTKTT